jgi:hypothetical protein
MRPGAAILDRQGDHPTHVITISGAVLEILNSELLRVA